MKLKLAAIFAVLAMPAQAAFLTGNDLHNLCQQRLTIPMSDESSAMFVLGVADTMQSLANGTGICIPQGVSGGQIRDVVCRSLESLPEIRHMEAGAISMASLINSFPCEGNL